MPLHFWNDPDGTRYRDAYFSCYPGVWRHGDWITAGYWMPLFVVLAAGATLDDPLREKIKEAIRAGASPRHVRDEIIEVPGIPHTRTGKKLEVPVKRLLQGAPVEQVANPAPVDAPDLIDHFARLGAERLGRST